MYSVTYIGDNGLNYTFGVDGKTVFDMDIGNGISVNIGTSQGYSQIGETIESQTVGSRYIKVNGVVYGNITERKKTMRKVFSPFSSGKLVFENKYCTRVYTKDPPTFSVLNNDGRFSMQFIAPFPFFQAIEESYGIIGGIKPAFSFPVNYAQPHYFGIKNASRYTNIYNDGEVEVPFSLFLATSAMSTNITITNLKTLQKLKINGTLNVGETIKIYRDNNNIFRAELTRNGVSQDVLWMIDESSDLFTLRVGDNAISATDDEGGENLNATIKYYPAVVALYES